ncbi:MAG: EAL domain-containing protein [Alphaproteobacteria bacterium]|nr:EAL domain-containing protein [Alphaproteobacteria bacterium]
MGSALERISGRMLSVIAGGAAFALTLLGFLLIGGLNQQVAASLLIGLFALCIVRMAAERPNAEQARAVAALIDRLLAVRRGDLTSPAPDALKQAMPELGSAVDGLFEQVRSTLDDVHALAMYDPVTSLPNRIHFRREAEQILRATRADGSSALLFIDLDGFKEVNDWLGHAQGDQVLALVAGRLRTVVQAEAEPAGSPPLIARLAGDEFTILLPQVSSRQEAERIAGAVVRALGEPFPSGENASYLGASIGIALAPEHGEDLTQLMKAADIAMYHAKASGRGRTCVYDAALARASEERAKSDAALRRAVSRGELELVYQPQLCLRTGAIVGAEAVVRWNHPAGERWLPDDLGSLCHERAVALEIGDWTLTTAMDALARWRRDGLSQRLVVPVRRQQLQRGDAFERLRNLLLTGAVAPGDVEIEISSSLLADCDARMLRGLEALRRDGVRLCLGGFGEGNASLVRVASLAADRIKLDASLIADIASSPRARAVATSLVHLIHGLGCSAVAIAADRQEQLEVLRAVGCDEVQGFLGAEAMAEAAFVRWALGQDCARSLARATA